MGLGQACCCTPAEASSEGATLLERSCGCAGPEMQACSDEVPAATAAPDRVTLPAPAGTADRADVAGAERLALAATMELPQAASLPPPVPIRTLFCSLQI
jgi:hypothetical protein